MKTTATLFGKTLEVVCHHTWGPFDLCHASGWIDGMYCEVCDTSYGITRKIVLVRNLKKTSRHHTEPNLSDCDFLRPILDSLDEN